MKNTGYSVKCSKTRLPVVFKRREWIVGRMICTFMLDDSIFNLESVLETFFQDSKLCLCETNHGFMCEIVT